MEELYLLSPTAYDDAFHTLITECKGLVIPLINEMFDEHYRGDEKICFARNEHFINQKGGGEVKRITDTSFLVIGDEKRRYHLECESTPDDSSILIRIFEYDAQIALDLESELLPHSLVVTFPHTAVLLLRSTDKTKDSFTIVIRTPGGEVSYDVPAMKVKDYSLEDIFERKLYCLIPFYIFTYEDRFKEINRDSSRIEALTNEFKEIMEMLDQLTLDGVINTFYKVSIIDMSRRVLYNLTKNYEDLRKGVIEVMGGQVLDYEAKRIYHEGMEEGREEGRQEGREEGSINTLVSLVKKGIITLHSAAAEAGISEDDFSKKMKSV